VPQTEIVFYCGTDGEAPVLEWLRDLQRSEVSAYEKCLVAIERLEILGHEARRPMADLLRDGIHELRVRYGRVNYRILYFFHGRQVAVLAHMITKEDVVPRIEIERASRRRDAFRLNPTLHTLHWEQ